MFIWRFVVYFFEVWNPKHPITLTFSVKFSHYSDTVTFSLSKGTFSKTQYPTSYAFCLSFVQINVGGGLITPPWRLDKSFYRLYWNLHGSIMCSWTQETWNWVAMEVEDKDFETLSTMRYLLLCLFLLYDYLFYAFIDRAYSCWQSWLG